MPEPLIIPGASGIDYLVPQAGGNFVGQGSVAQRMLSSGFNSAALRSLDVLQKEEWIQFDQRLVEVARDRMPAVADLMGRGLTLNLTNGLGTTVLQWENVSHMEGATVSMNGVTEAERDRVKFETLNLPLPIVHKDFWLNLRTLEASRRLGQSLDVTQIDQATRLVSEKIENMLFDGHALNVGGNSIMGFTNAQHRNTGSLISDWDNSGTTTGEEIVQDVLQMVSDATTDKMFGPYTLYVPVSYYNRLSDDYKANSDRTILERILAHPLIEKVIPTSNLSGGASGEVLLVQVTSNVVDMVTGMQPTLVQWDSHGGFMINFKVMAIMVPRVKWDYNDQSGIVHHSV